MLIVEVHTYGWMSSSSLFSCTVRKYRNTLSLENEIFLANFLHELLDTFVSGLKSFNEVDLKLTCQPVSKTIRFGIESKSLPMLRQVDNYPTCNIIKCRLSDLSPWSRLMLFERIIWTAYPMILLSSSKHPVRFFHSVSLISVTFTPSQNLYYEITYFSHSLLRNVL